MGKYHHERHTIKETYQGNGLVHTRVEVFEKTIKGGLQPRVGQNDIPVEKSNSSLFAQISTGVLSFIQFATNQSLWAWLKGLLTKNN